MDEDVLKLNEEFGYKKEIRKEIESLLISSKIARIILIYFSIYLNRTGQTTTVIKLKELSEKLMLKKASVYATTDSLCTLKLVEILNKRPRALMISTETRGDYYSLTKYAMDLSINIEKRNSL